MLGILVQFNYIDFRPNHIWHPVFHGTGITLMQIKVNENDWHILCPFRQVISGWTWPWSFFFPGVRAHLTKADVVYLLWYIYIRVVHGKNVHFSNIKQKCCGYIFCSREAIPPHCLITYELYMVGTWGGIYNMYIFSIIFGTLLRVPTFSSWLTNSCVLWSVNARCLRKAHVGCPKKMCVIYRCMSIVCVYRRKMAENPLGPGGFIFRNSTIDLRGFLRDLVSKTCKPVQCWFSVSLFCITV